MSNFEKLEKMAKTLGQACLAQSPLASGMTWHCNATYPHVEWRGTKLCICLPGDADDRYQIENWGETTALVPKKLVQPATLAFICVGGKLMGVGLSIVSEGV